MNIEQRVDILDRDMRDLRGEMNGLRGEVNGLRGEVSDLRVDVTDIKARIPYLATKEEVAHSRNVIIYWLIGLFLATGVYNHIPIFTNQHHSDSQTLISSANKTNAI